MFVYSAISCLTFEKPNSPYNIIKFLIIAGTCVSIYIPLKYGVSEYLRGMINGIRMGDKILQVNALGQCTAYSAVMAFAMILFYKKKWCIPCIIVMTFICLGTGSRQALLTIILGVFLICFFYFLLWKKDKLKSFIKFISTIIVMLFIGYIILKYVPYFETIYERFSGLVKVILGIQNSTEGVGVNGIRNVLIKTGLNQFWEHPLFGIGFNNGQYAANETIGYVVYLHNNFVEVLCNGGIVGFCIYYSIYLSLIVKHIKKLKYQNPVVVISLTLIFINLIGSMAGVFYFEKYFYGWLILWIVTANSNFNLATYLEQMEK